MTHEPPNLTNLNYFEEMWERYRENPDSVSSEWRTYFEVLEANDTASEDASPRLTTGQKQLHQGFGPPLGEFAAHVKLAEGNGTAEDRHRPPPWEERPWLSR